MVPIHDRQGRIIGFGGRSLEGVEPKYLNSPETEVFEKGKHLFGLDKAADPIRRADCAIVVDACTIAQIANPDEIMDRQIFNWGEQCEYMLCAVALIQREGVGVDTMARVC